MYSKLNFVVFAVVYLLIACAVLASPLFAGIFTLFSGASALKAFML